MNTTDSYAGIRVSLCLDFCNPNKSKSAFSAAGATRCGKKIPESTSPLAQCPCRHVLNVAGTKCTNFVEKASVQVTHLARCDGLQKRHHVVRGKARLRPSPVRRSPPDPPGTSYPSLSEETAVVAQAGRLSVLVQEDGEAEGGVGLQQRLHRAGNEGAVRGFRGEPELSEVGGEPPAELRRRPTPAAAAAAPGVR